MTWRNQRSGAAVLAAGCACAAIVLMTADRAERGSVRASQATGAAETTSSQAGSASPTGRTAARLEPSAVGVALVQCGLTPAALGRAGATAADLSGVGERLGAHIAEHGPELTAAAEDVARARRAVAVQRLGAARRQAKSAISEQPVQALRRAEAAWAAARTRARTAALHGLDSAKSAALPSLPSFSIDQTRSKQQSAQATPGLVAAPSTAATAVAAPTDLSATFNALVRPAR